MSRFYILPDLSDSTPPIIPVSDAAPAAKAGPSDLRLRVIYGLLGAALLLGSVWSSPLTFALFFAAVQVKMLLEFYRMMRAGGYAPATWLGVATGLLIFGSAYTTVSYYMSENMVTSAPTLTIRGESNMLAGATGKLAFMLDAWFWESQTWLNLFAWPCAILMVLAMVLLLREMTLWPKYPHPFQNIGSTLAGIFYISLPMSLLTVLAFNYNGYDYRRVFALLFLIWASDIGAYAAGKSFGKHKLAPSISPGKTWEGWAGGFLLTLAVGWALKFMLPELPLAYRLVAAGVVAVFAPLGDLAESMLKRSVGVKDSGHFLPGHGGLLDRFDAFLLVLPVLALLQLLAK